MNEINPQWIQNRIENFFGYGNLDSPIWFIGIEDGINPDIGMEFINKRFELTQGIDNHSVIDVIDDMNGVEDHLEWYLCGSNPQPTFRRIIQILLQYENVNDFSRKKILDFQKGKLGRVKSNHALLELMPLPNRKSGSWLYKDYGRIGGYNLKSRSTYLKTVLEYRIGKFQKLIEEKKPKVLVCYSYDDRYINQWPKLLTHNKLKELPSPVYYRHYQHNGTHLFVTPHTIASSLKKYNHPKMTDNDWNTIRNEIVNVLWTNKFPPL